MGCRRLIDIERIAEGVNLHESARLDTEAVMVHHGRRKTISGSTGTGGRRTANQSYLREPLNHAKC